MDQAAFDTFYAQSYNRVVAQLYLTCGNLGEAQDCAQEAFIRAWQHRRTLNTDDHPEAWVRTVAHRISVSRWRKHRRSTPTEFVPDSGVSDPDVASQIAVRKALAELPVETRRVIVLHHFNDLPVADIAAELELPEGTVKARLSRGRAKLAAALTRPDRAEALSGSMTLMEDAMTEPDPFGLKKLAEPALRVIAPSASQIRAAGTSRARRRITGVVAASVAGAVLIGGVAVGVRGDWQVLPWVNPSAAPSSHPTGITTPDAGGSPSVPAMLTWEQVPTQEEVSYQDQQLIQTDQEEGWPEQWAMSRCIADREQLDPSQMLIRSFSGGENGPVTHAGVMQFDTTDAATAAREQIDQWYTNCDQLWSEGGDQPWVIHHDSQDITLDPESDFPDGTVADYHLIQWREDEQSGQFEESVVLQVGDRVIWYMQDLGEMPDRNCAPDQDRGTHEELCTPIHNLPDFARRLAS